MNNYASITLLNGIFYDNIYLDNQFTHFATIDYLNVTYTNIVVLSTNSHNKIETDNLLANKVSNIGNVSLPGHLDIGTTYTNSRIRCNANVAGYTGYAELNCASSYDLFLDLSTTRPNGGWVSFKINNDNYIQLSGSDNKVNSYKDTTININLDVGSSFKTSLSDGTYTATAELTCPSPWDWNFNLESYRTNWGWFYLRVKGVSYMQIASSAEIITFYNETTITNTLTVDALINNSDDRLKEHEVIIEHACQTLSKLRPQLYDKTTTTDMENNDTATWIKESVLIAQEVCHDAPELRHLVHRENNSELPEIPTSIDPQQDPDYSSWGEEPASVNYIGLIAYLIKANNELHERVKALESK